MSETVVLPSSPVAGPLPGDVIAGKYRLERELGRGAMGTVWAALHVTLNQRVAIKLISGEQSQSVEARQRFGVEAKAAARLRSRHVVQVYDDGETPDGTPYIVMEYLEGETLEQRLERNRDMGLPEAVRITSHVGRALARAHARGIVHRDLKSGNVFIAKSEDDELGWVAKVLDFGVAKVLTEVSGPSATKTGTIVGTPLFMSPEQIRGASQVDQRADLYSLGMVFYNMVTGSHAFDGPSYSDVLVAICTEALPDIRIAAPWLPAALGAWFDKACARERDERFASADEMIEALQEAAGPNARVSRASMPDEIAGPSGTLVGHVPPHAAATVMALDVSAMSSSAASVVRAARIEGGSSNSGKAEPARATELDRPRPRVPDHLLLWGVTGVGLACGVMALVIVLGRTAGPAAPAVVRSEPVAAKPDVPAMPTAEPARTTAPGAVLAPPSDDAPLAPLTPTPATATSAPEAAAVGSAASRQTTRRTATVTAPKPVPATTRNAAAPGAERPTPAPVARPAAAPGAPDMGF